MPCAVIDTGETDTDADADTDDDTDADADTDADTDADADADAEREIRPGVSVKRGRSELLDMPTPSWTSAIASR